MYKFESTVMYERFDGTIGEDVKIIIAKDIDDACDIAERAVASKGKFFYSDVKLIR